MPGATPEERIHHDRRVLQQGEADYYVRPYYMSTDPSEVQGPTDKQQV